MIRKIFVIGLILFFTSPLYGASVAKPHLWTDGETPTAALWNANEDAMIIGINDIDAENITDSTISEADMKCVNTPADGDIFTYESTTGDWEHHTLSEILAEQGATIDDDGANGEVIIIDNDGTNHALYIKQDGILAASDYGLYVYSNAAQTNSSLVYFHSDNASSNKTVATFVSDGVGNGVVMSTPTVLDANKHVLTVSSNAAQTNADTYVAKFSHANANTTSGCVLIDTAGQGPGLSIFIDSGVTGSHMYMEPVASVTGSTEGFLYADGDTATEILYYHSGSGWAACNADNDFGEVMQVEGNKNSYEIGDVISIGTEKIKKLEYESGLKDKKVKKINDSKFSDNSTCVTKSKGAYDTTIMGVYSDRTGYILDDHMSVNDNRITVGLIGLVKCKVNNEGGAIKAGDPLVSSSKKGVAMKGTIDSFDKMRAIIGKAREDFNGTEAIIEILVGVK